MNQTPPTLPLTLYLFRVLDTGGGYLRQSVVAQLSTIPSVFQQVRLRACVHQLRTIVVMIGLL